MILNVLKTFVDQLQGGRNLGKPSEQTLAPGQPNRTVDDCIGRKTMNVTILEPEYVARQMESADLTTTIHEKFVSANRTLPQLVYVVGRLCFSKDLGASPIPELMPERSFAD